MMEGIAENEKEIREDAQLVEKIKRGEAELRIVAPKEDLAKERHNELADRYFGNRNP